MGAAGTGARVAIIAALCCACAHRQAHAYRVVATYAPQGGVFHHVKAGETLWRISRTYGASIEELLRENALADPSSLAEGSLLFVRGAERELSVPPADAPSSARTEPRPSRRAGPAQIPRAGSRPLDPAARGEALSWPANGVLISGFGARERDQHDGIDLAAPEGTPIRAAADGVVIFAGQQRGYGNLVLLAHEGDLVTVYAHNSQNLVAPGRRVARGEPIARVGRTGNATGPHLHFEVRLGTHPRDPLGFLR